MPKGQSCRWFKVLWSWKFPLTILLTVTHATSSRKQHPSSVSVSCMYEVWAPWKKTLRLIDLCLKYIKPWKCLPIGQYWLMNLPHEQMITTVKKKNLNSVLSLCAYVTVSQHLLNLIFLFLCGSKIIQNNSIEFFFSAILTIDLILLCKEFLSPLIIKLAKYSLALLQRCLYVGLKRSSTLGTFHGH